MKFKSLLLIAQKNREILTRDFNKYDDFKIKIPISINRKKPLQLLAINDALSFCKLFDYSMPSIQKIIDNRSYTEFKIPKKRNGYRTIHEPNEDLKIIQNKLNHYLQLYYYQVKPKPVFGFVINAYNKNNFCNIVQNAKLHTNKKTVLNIDIKNFFPSIDTIQIKNLFMGKFFEYPENLATALTLLTTHQDILPIGAPTSPVISNFICYDMDLKFLEYCTENNIVYSRYADDMTFSSNQAIDNSHKVKINEILSIYKFKINQNKYRLKYNNRKQTVTGLVVNKKVNVDRKTLKNIRAMLHDANKKGISNATAKHLKNKKKLEVKDIEYFLNKLKGLINFVSQVKGKHDPLVIKFKEEYDLIIKINKYLLNQ